MQSHTRNTQTSHDGPDRCRRPRPGRQLGSADGTPDADFGTRGFTMTTIGSYAVPQALLIERDGDIVAGGTANIDGIFEFAVARYLATAGEALVWPLCFKWRKPQTRLTLRCPPRPGFRAVLTSRSPPCLAAPSGPSSVSF